MKDSEILNNFSIMNDRTVKLKCRLDKCNDQIIEMRNLQSSFANNQELMWKILTQEGSRQHPRSMILVLQTAFMRSMMSKHMGAFIENWIIAALIMFFVFICIFVICLLKSQFFA